MNNERSCDKLLVKNNSRKHFVVFCALIEAKGTDIKMIKEELLITHHGRTLHGYFFKPEEKGCFPLVIMSHGYNGCKDDFEKTAKYLADAKIASVACTFCGGSTRDESGFPTTQMTLFTEKEDLMAILESMEQRPNINKKQIFLFGASQGGLISAMVAEECKEKVAGRILLFPALCIADDWRVRFKSESEIPKEFEFWGMKLGEEFFKSMRNFKTFDVIGHFERPVLILHGAEDEIVPIGYSVKAVKKYPNARLEEFAHEPHGFSEDGNRRMEAMLLYFVHECMKAGEEWEGRI